MQREDSMALEEKWVTIIAAGVDTLRNYIKDSLGPSKKELKIKIEELNKMVDRLADQNMQMSSSMANITQAILDQLSTEYNIAINVDSITIIGQNTTNNSLTNHQTDDHSVTNQISTRENVSSPKITDVFSGIDEEIASTRVKPITQLEEEYDIYKYISQDK